MEPYTYECTKCGVDNKHLVKYVAPTVVAQQNNQHFPGPCLVVACRVCGYAELWACADQAR